MTQKEFQVIKEALENLRENIERSFDKGIKEIANLLSSNE